MRETANRTKNPEDWELYKKQRNKCSNYAKNDKRKYYTDKYNKCQDEGDTKKLYNLTKTQLGWNTGGTPTTFQKNGKTVNSPKILAEMQNEYFTEKVKKLTDQLPSEDDLPDPLKHLKNAIKNWDGIKNVEKLKLKETNADEIKKIHKKTKKLHIIWK